MVLCFVEFVDEKCALTAMEALQGMKNVFPFLIFLLELYRALKSRMLLLACIVSIYVLCKFVRNKYFP